MQTSDCGSQHSKVDLWERLSRLSVPATSSPPCLPPISGAFRREGTCEDGEREEEEVITKLPYLQSSPCTPQISPL